MSLRPHSAHRPFSPTLFVFAVAAALALPGLTQAAPGKGKANSAARPDSAPDVVQYGQREDVVTFAQRITERHQLPTDWAVKQLATARYLPRVAQLVMPPVAGVQKNWEAYRGRFVDAQRVRDGVRWWAQHEDSLRQAEARYGVPAAIIVAIVGVETYYGRITGDFKVIDALATLAFDFPKGRSDRSSFYQDELEAFLRWCAREGRDPHSVKGSYAGAIGLPQFMPSSILKYAIDFDGDGKIDLNSHGADVVGSVANYFAQFGWEPGQPTHFAVKPPTDARDRAHLLGPDISPTFTAQQMTDRGAELDEAGRTYSGPLALVELQMGDRAPVHIAGTKNFYVVTRYNWSSYYALAVIELARSLRQARPDAKP